MGNPALLLCLSQKLSFPPRIKCGINSSGNGGEKEMNNMCIVIPAQAGIHDNMPIFWNPIGVYLFGFPLSRE
jgi:hypothetical protein